VRHCPTCGSDYADQIEYCPTDGSATQRLQAPEARDNARDDSLLGVVVDGRYRIEARIGDGGMGVVYRATHVALKKPFAIKVMRGEQAHDPDVVQRFVQEARAASAIGHPNIVNINDFGSTVDGAVYLAMEFLAGQTLAQAMESGPIECDRALRIFIQIAGALEATHEHGIVHRDLKPENIFLKPEPENPDFVKVLDFGVAKVRNATANITRTGMVVGTPHYMSPEQAAGQPVDHRSDIYSLGVIMYQALSGQLPFSAESFTDVMTKHMYEPPQAPSFFGVELPQVLEALVLQGLSKKPEERPQSMRELQLSLQRIQARAAFSEPAAGPARFAGVSAEPEPERARAVAAPVPSPTQPSSTAPRSPAPRYDSQPAAASWSPDAVAESPTLQAAAVHTIWSDDEVVSVPKSGRPLWFWACVLGVVAVAMAFVFRIPNLEAPAASSAPTPAVEPPGPTPVAAVPADVPAETAAPAQSVAAVHTPEEATAKAPAKAPASTPAKPPAAAPAKAPEKAAAKPAKSNTAAAEHPAPPRPVSVQPASTPRPANTPAVQKRPARAEPNDPWR